MPSKNIESVAKESRSINPKAAFRKKALVKSEEEYLKLYKQSVKNPDKFWSMASKDLHWFKNWRTLSKWKAPFSEWFIGGKLNVSYNCVDRHVNSPLRNKAAIIWEGEPGDKVTLTYQQLHTEVCKFANVLKEQGVKSGDRVAIYMPMIPESAVVMLACTRIGAPHTVVFGGFSAESLKERINDCGAKVVVTADGGYRRVKKSL